MQQSHADLQTTLESRDQQRMDAWAGTLHSMTAALNKHWEQIGEPEYLSAQVVAELKEKSLLLTETVEFTYTDGSLKLELSMPPQSVAAVHFSF